MSSIPPNEDLEVKCQQGAKRLCQGTNISLGVNFENAERDMELRHVRRKVPAVQRNEPYHKQTARAALHTGAVMKKARYAAEDSRLWQDQLENSASRSGDNRPFSLIATSNTTESISKGRAETFLPKVRSYLNPHTKSADIEQPSWKKFSNRNQGCNTISSTMVHTQNIPCHPLTLSRRIKIDDLLGSSISPTKHVPLHPPQSAIYTTSSGQKSRDSSLGNLQDEAPAPQSDTRGLIPSKRTSSDTVPLEGKSERHDRASVTPGPASARGPQVKSMSNPREKKPILDGGLVAEQLNIKGKLLFPHPQWQTPNQWVSLSIDTLLTRTPPEFFCFYSQIAGAGEISVLSFNFPDVTWQRLQWNISRSDSNAFYALKRAVWDTFCLSMIWFPGTAVFRVTAEAVGGEGLGKAPSTTKTPAHDTGSSKGSKPLRALMTKRIAVSSSTESVNLSPSAPNLPGPITRSPWHERPRQTPISPGKIAEAEDAACSCKR
ncbi:uncharacterized protein K444DRAFT_697274 [Hyaloscypha bicolor E]|uniref:Uncharacterized protein n=1 Tax=Hyaloscypha bicolor E TaxID=1095630 RepID=A0A2J6SX11_9HELO|nr:uncharacterized protein K444DRAFT_697274 [Hyaloscypha bicolor E]PMD55316.1 hypothetical protein K444DRAFT_697274 [Hyaloscypha bicolor E]